MPAPDVLFGGMLAVALLFGVQAATTQHHEQDQGAVQFLESLWLTPPHRALPFWPDPAPEENSGGWLGPSLGGRHSLPEKRPWLAFADTPAGTDLTREHHGSPRTDRS